MTNAGPFALLRILLTQQLALSFPCLGCTWMMQWRVRAARSHHPRVKAAVPKEGTTGTGSAPPAEPPVSRAGPSPRVRELQVGDIEDPFPVGTVVVIHKFLQLHLAVFLFGDIGDINAPLWSYKLIQWKRDWRAACLAPFCVLGGKSAFRETSQPFDFLIFSAFVSSLLFMHVNTYTDIYKKHVHT